MEADIALLQVPSSQAPGAGQDRLWGPRCVSSPGVAGQHAKQEYVGAPCTLQLHLTTIDWRGTTPRHTVNSRSFYSDPGFAAAISA